MAIGKTSQRFNRDTAIDEAIQVFWSKGYRGTRLQDLMTALGFSKSSLYQSFASKEQIFLECLERYVNDMVGDMRKRLDDADSGREFIIDSLAKVARTACTSDARKGCLLWNTVSEIGTSNTQIATLAEHATDDLVSVFASALDRAKSAGELRRDLENKSTAVLLVSYMCGLQLMVKGGLGRRRARRSVDSMISALL